MKDTCLRRDRKEEKKNDLFQLILNIENFFQGLKIRQKCSNETFERRAKTTLQRSQRRIWWNMNNLKKLSNSL